MLRKPYRLNDFDPPIPFLTGDASTLHSIISEIDRVNSLSPVDIQARQALYLHRLIWHFSRSSHDFSKRLKKRLSPSTKGEELASLLRLVEPADKFYFQKIREIERVPKHHLPTYWTSTSGSTGVPLKVKGTAITRAIRLAMVPWTHLASGTEFSWKMASVKPTNTISGVSKTWDPASSLLYEVGPMLSISTSEDIIAQLDKITDFQPNVLIVFPSVLKEYVYIWERGLRQPPKVRVIRTMGESLSAEVRELAEVFTGAVVLDTYSSSEVGRIATQVSHQSPYIVNNFSLVVEILNEEGVRCAPGEMGRVVITDLQNYATPLIRYDTGDWAVPEDEFHLKLKSIGGRSRNVIRLPDGRRVWPLVGYRDFSKVFPIRQFHVRQVETSKLEAVFYVDQLPTLREEREICEIICKSLDFDFEIKSSYQTRPIEKGANGKLEDFVSLVQY